MTQLERLRKIINWLIYQGVADNDTSLAKVLGMQRPSFSKVANGMVPLSEKLAAKICALDNTLSIKWLMEGTGQMFLEEGKNYEASPEPPVAQTAKIQNLNETIHKLMEAVEARDRQIDRLLTMLEAVIAENRKISERLQSNLPDTLQSE